MTGVPVPFPMPEPAVAVGCDVVPVERVAALVSRHGDGLARVFGPAELADAVRDGVALDSPVAAARLAARFAAKEAARKALGGRGPTLTAFEVRTDEAGRPTLWVDGSPTALACSLSHAGGVAMAVVVATRDVVDALVGDADPDRPEPPSGVDRTSDRGG